MRGISLEDCFVKNWPSDSEECERMRQEINKTTVAVVEGEFPLLIFPIFLNKHAVTRSLYPETKPTKII